MYFDKNELMTGITRFAQNAREENAQVFLAPAGYGPEVLDQVLGQLAAWKDLDQDALDSRGVQKQATERKEQARAAAGREFGFLSRCCRAAIGRNHPILTALSLATRRRSVTIQDPDETGSDHGESPSRTGEISPTGEEAPTGMDGDGPATAGEEENGAAKMVARPPNRSDAGNLRRWALMLKGARGLPDPFLSKLGQLGWDENRFANASALLADYEQADREQLKQIQVAQAKTVALAAETEALRDWYHKAILHAQLVFEGKDPENNLRLPKLVSI